MIGKRKGIFKRHTVTAVFSNDKDLIICDDCCNLMKQIVAEDEGTQQFNQGDG